MLARYVPLTLPHKGKYVAQYPAPIFAFSSAFLKIIAETMYFTCILNT